MNSHVSATILSLTSLADVLAPLLFASIPLSCFLFFGAGNRRIGIVLPPANSVTSKPPPPPYGQSINPVGNSFAAIWFQVVLLMKINPEIGGNMEKYVFIVLGVRKKELNHWKATTSLMASIGLLQLIEV